MPTRDENAFEEESEIEEKTKELMEEALRKSDSDLDMESKPAPDTRETNLEAADQILATYERIESRMNDVLSSIEDSLGNTETEVQEEASAATARILKKLQEAGLGVFANRASSVVKKELDESLSPETSLHHVYQAIESSRKEVHDILSKASRGSAKAVKLNLNNLRTKLVKAHALLNEREHELESLKADNSALRTKINELEERNKQKEQKISNLQDRAKEMENIEQNLYQQIQERDEKISNISGELSQAKSEIEQQEKLIAKLDSAEELVIEYEESAERISQLTGKVSSLEESLSQKEETIEKLKSRISHLDSERDDFANKVEKLTDELSQLKGELKTSKSDLQETLSRTKELEARWDVLVKIAEDEPTFKAYFIIADKSQWFPLSHLSSALGIPTVRLEGQLEKFVEAGLIEIKNDKIRPIKLSEVDEDTESSKTSSNEIQEDNAAADSSIENEDADST